MSEPQLNKEIPPMWVWKLDQKLGEFKHGFAQVLYNFLLSYNLGVDEQGNYVDLETKVKLRRNHLKCMLRNDYLASGHGELEGSKLCHIIDRFLDDVVKAVNRMVLAPGVVRFGEFSLSDSYL